MTMINEIKDGISMVVCDLQIWLASGGSLVGEINGANRSRDRNVSLSFEEFEDLDNEG